MSLPVPSYSLYGETFDDRFPDALHVETIHARSSLHEWRIREHRHHDLLQLFVITSGGGTAHFEDRAAVLAPQCLFAVPPLTVHGFSFVPGTAGFVASLPVTSAAGALGAASPLGLRLKSPPHAAQPGQAAIAEAIALMEQAHREFSARLPGRREALTLHAGLLALFFARIIEGPEAPRDTAPHHQHIKAYLGLVEEHFRQDVPLAFYAGRLGVSLPHLTRLCREVLGKSASGVVQERRILEARRYLVYTSMPVAQVGEALGFSDPAYFSRFFSQRTGKSPSDYRADVMSMKT